jgi:NTP pyrophosphatase (non-canonical NTP hydrolase)
MTKDKVIELVFEELRKAEAKHPSWPNDPIHGAAIVAEEAGELIQASIDYYYKHHTRLPSDYAMMKEAAQTAAMGIRFLLNLSA